MSRLLYEKSVSYQGHLIIPFVFTKADDQPIYSYKLLSELGRKGNFHQADNPAGMYSDNCENIVKIAKEHLDVNSDVSSDSSDVTFFKRRYTYRYNLIILHGKAGKYFYDHYRPDSLNNIAAPKIFESEIECISWIKQGLDRAPSREQPKKA